MKKSIFVFVIFLLILVGSDCFAQNAEVRARALQGEWLITVFDNIDFSKPPYSEIIEMIWIFDGNNYLLRSKDIQNEKIEAESGTFRMVADAIIFSHQDGITQTGVYTLQGNVLTVNIEGSIIISNKR
jgi:hypothetical protein